MAIREKVTSFSWLLCLAISGKTRKAFLCCGKAVEFYEDMLDFRKSSAFF